MKPGLNLVIKPTAMISPDFSAISTSSLAFLGSSAMGFSIKTCLPAPRAFSASEASVVAHVHIVTASISSLLKSSALLV